MSGIAGLLCLSDRPVDAGLLRRMTDAVRHRGPDAGGCWSDGGVALGQRTMASTPESLGELGPLYDAEADLCLAFDGRLDNRADLIRALDLASEARAGLSDAALLLRAYRAWQEGVAGRILGDFAFAIWDGRRRSLYCARDPMGIRPLHYVSREGLFAFGSELHQLLLVPGVSGELNEGMAGEYLAWAIATHGETLYRDIRTLPPGHAMTIDAGGRVRMRRFWDVDFAARIRYRSEDDYAEHLVELLRASIECRLRARGRLGVALSGGLDSSTVCTLAGDLLRSRGGPAAGLDAYGVAFPGLACDESAFIRVSAAHAGVPLHLVPLRDEVQAGFAARALRTRNFPGYPMANGIMGSVCTAARANGCRVMLSGEGSDEIFGGAADQMADLFVRFRFGALRREARAVAASSEISQTRVLLRHVVKPWLDRTANALGLNGYRKPDLPWLSERWTTAIDLRSRIAPRSPRAGAASCAQLADYRSMFSPHNVHYYEMMDICGFDAGVEYRHPLFDRRLVEFAYAIPHELLMREGRGKRLLRYAMRGRLEAATVESGTNADFTVVNMRALDRILLERPVARWPAALAGWITADTLESQFRSARADLLAGRRGRGRAFWNLWMAYGIGLVAEASSGQSQAI